MLGSRFMKVITNILTRLSKYCAYSHIYKVLYILIRGGKLSDQTKMGRNIALLGIFCPFFWFALFTGADSSTLVFHASHSSIVFLIGVFIMWLSLKKRITTDEQ